jgi:hypothetical protein
MLAKTTTSRRPPVTPTELPELDIDSPSPAGRSKQPRGRGVNSTTVVGPPPRPAPAGEPTSLASPPASAGQTDGAETARAKFERLCVARMNRALVSIRLLGNLASPNYRWDEPDVEAIQAALSAAVNDTLAKFEKRKKTKPHFTLPPADAGQATHPASAGEKA